MSKNDLFTTNQAARLCSVSRATVLRMEERGLVIPSVRSADNQPRYYTPSDISRLLQVLSLSDKGFSQEEILKILDPSGFQEGIRDLEAKLYYMNRILEELRGRFDSTHIGTVFEFHSPDTYCYCLTRSYNGGFAESAALMHDAFMEAARKGCRLDSDVPYFLMIDRDLTDRNPIDEPSYTACIPVQSSCADIEGVVKIPGSLVLSLAWAGPSKEVRRAVDSLLEEAAHRNYRIAGALRACTWTDHYGASDITDENEVIRFHLPVRQTKNCCCKGNSAPCSEQ